MSGAGERPESTGKAGSFRRLVRNVRKQTDAEARIRHLVEAARAYQSDYLNPVPDYGLRRRLRERLFAALDEVGEFPA